MEDASPLAGSSKIWNEYLATKNTWEDIGVILLIFGSIFLVLKWLNYRDRIKRMHRRSK